jgi:hypothetical protein
MPELQTQSPPGERFRHPPGSPARRAIVAAVVTELAAVLEPVGRDPFIDGCHDTPRLRQTPPIRGRIAALRRR